jgi:hypothetical protein
MKRQALLITLIDDCVFSARAATLGGHEGLDRIPGQTLLGAAASRLYARLDARGGFEAFHSGKLRFCDGLPTDGEAVAYPMPLAWHKAKTAPNTPLDGQDGIQAYNFLHVQRIPAMEGVAEPQPKQLRIGYLFEDYRTVKPGQALRMKTAIDPKEGRAAEGQLFGYESLSRGQRFIAWIEADDAFDTALFEQVVESLSGELLLGRSRSAEYGRVLIERTDIAPPGPGRVIGNSLSLLLLSDLALVDGQGRPTLDPDPRHLGLGEGEVDWGRTFLRSRRYSPWNAYRHGYDRERLLLSAGGVITLKNLAQPPSTEDCVRLMSGVGLFRECGLGRLWVNPSLLEKEKDLFVDNEKSEQRVQGAVG